MGLDVPLLACTGSTGSSNCGSSTTRSTGCTVYVAGKACWAFRVVVDPVVVVFWW